MKYAPPTDSQDRRARLCQIDNQRSIEAETARRILDGDGPLQEWECDLLVQLHQEMKPWQEGTRGRIDNRLSKARAARVEQLRARDGAPA